MFLALFGCSFFALFGYIYWQTTGYLLAEVDTALHLEVDRQNTQPPELRRQEILKHNEQDPQGRLPYSLFDADGKLIVGAIAQLPALRHYDRPAEFMWDKASGHDRPIRFLAHRLEDGSTLLIGQDIHDIREFDELLVNALVSGGALLLVVGLLGAIVLGISARRRLDILTRSIKNIVEGDLSERLPTRGNHDDIDRIAGVVNGMLDALERLMSEVKGVCDDIAHDLRTPLTRLIAGLERAQRRNLTAPEYDAAIASALEDAKGLMQTFRALLRISEIEGSARRSHFTPVDLNKICADAVELFEPLAEERGMTLAFTPSNRASLVMGDAQLLFDATCNLLDNAIKFSPDQSQVEVMVLADATHRTISIRDRGPGIPEAEREAVFRRLYRSESSRHTPGNGLGLSMVSAVARLHDMTLQVRDAQPGCRLDLIGHAYNA
ncbi:HAMP domain-containing protein [Pseudomonas sp. Fl5BN2]|nr:HAMP domain-containing protein [Pseudomonas sp. Fl5BN2]NBF10801.1 HAMP domain-containing protein [Pseudomonas sp. Fl4BN1]